MSKQWQFSFGAKFPIHAQPGQKDVRSVLQSYFQLYTLSSSKPNCDGIEI
jgi:hypothetical protein